MKVMGFDLSSRKLAMMRFDNDEPGEPWISEPPKKLKHRPDVLAQFIEPLQFLFEREAKSGDLWVFIEHPLVGRAGAHATIVQAQVQGLVLGLAVQFGAAGVYEVNVQTWKKVVVGNGRADKDQIAEWLATHQPRLAELAGDDQDLVDASCVALYGRDVVERGAKLQA